MIDMVGLSQKNGAVVTHLKIAARAGRHLGGAHRRRRRRSHPRLRSCDGGIRAGAVDVRPTRAPARSSTRMKRCRRSSPAMPISRLPGEQMLMKIAARGQGRMDCMPSRRRGLPRRSWAIRSPPISSSLGYAYQNGLIPLSAAAIEEAIRLNGAAIKMNLDAFLWGRRAAHDLEGGRGNPRAARAGRSRSRRSMISSIGALPSSPPIRMPAYAERYRQFVAMVRARERCGDTGIERC